MGAGLPPAAAFRAGGFGCSRPRLPGEVRRGRSDGFEETRCVSPHAPRNTGGFRDSRATHRPGAEAAGHGRVNPPPPTRGSRRAGPARHLNGGAFHSRRGVPAAPSAAPPPLSPHARGAAPALPHPREQRGRARVAPRGRGRGPPPSAHPRGSGRW